MRAPAASDIPRHCDDGVMWRGYPPGYTPPASMSTTFEGEPGRLNGWKEIALHLGKGARTVQRWEKLYGLPVHRLGREGGEIVFAFRDEIDRWVARTERERTANGDEPLGAPEAGTGAEPPDRPAPEGVEAAPTRRPWAAAALALAVVAGALGTLALSRRATVHPESARAMVRQPAAWRLANESLAVFDLTGALVFEHRFDFALGSAVTSESPVPEVGWLPVLMADIDGDGRTEVLVNVNAADRANRKLYCFEADGRVRFVHLPTGTRRFGEDDYADPWLAHRTFVTQGTGGHRRLWAAFTHNMLFPAVLRELDPRDGATRQEYWSNGYVETLHEDTWAGRRVVFVGGTNNDFRAASLAVFPVDGVAGSTPAVRPGYSCRNCPPGGPESLFVFPTLCLGRPRGQAGVHSVWLENGERIRVTVTQWTEGGLAASYYTLGPGGELLTAEISREFQAQHARLEREGSLDHAFGPRDDADMFPVLRWDGTRFVELPRVKVAH